MDFTIEIEDILYNDFGLNPDDYPSTKILKLFKEYE